MDITRNYHKGADTSVQAYQHTSEIARDKQGKAILDKLCEVKNATCEELERFLDLKHQSVSSRITELVKKGFIVDTGLRRKTDSNRNARVYELVKETCCHTCTDDKISQFLRGLIPQ